MNAPDPHAADLAVAHRLADAAAARSLSFFQREPRRWSKDDGSLVTEADMAVEDDLRSILQRERPDDAILGEERGLTGTGPRRWILDGIDGTVDFAAGGRDWATLIALQVDCEIVVGLCHEPLHRRRYWATRGSGAFASRGTAVAERQLRVSTGADLRTARSFLPPADWQRTEYDKRVVHELMAATSPEPYREHPALQVASGGYEVAVFLSGAPWDLAAPSLIVEEAGGTFTDLAGRPALTSGTAIFSNGRLHDAILRVIETAMDTSERR